MDTRLDPTGHEESRISRAQLFARTGVASVGIAGLGLLAENSSVQATTMLGSPAQQLSKAMRTLWEEHVAWTRLYIVSFAGGLPDTSATAHRLLRNQVDIGNAVKPFYGNAAGNQLTTLLKQHILGAVAILTAAKAGNTARVNQATSAWFTNANQIAAFLHSANPMHWPLRTMRSMMHQHLNLTLQEAVAQLHGNYPASVAAYDRIEQEILQMADMLTAGIVTQFPGRFPS